MTKDLEMTMDELGPEYLAVVNRLRAGRSIVPQGRELAVARRRLAVPGVLLAAALAGLALALTVWCVPGRTPDAGWRTVGSVAAYVRAYSQRAESLALIRATQRADGSWENDFLTCQNAAALRPLQDAASRTAYRRAVRYLRAHGLEALSDAELALRAKAAAECVRGCRLRLEERQLPSPGGRHQT